MNEKKIYFILEEFNPSGGLKIVTAIANTLATSGCQVNIIVPRYTEPSYYVFDDGVKITHLGKNVFGGMLFYFMRLFVFIRKLDAFVVTPNYRIAALCGNRIKKGNEQLIFLIQGDDEISLIKYSSTNRLGKWVNSILLKLSKDVDARRIFVSTYLQNLSNHKGQLIPNYISDTFIHSPKRVLFSDAEITIGTVSTSSPNKGFDLFLRIAEELLACEGFGKKNFKFICATQDNRLIHSNYRYPIDFVSPKNELEMSAFYQRCDIYLSCSISEGFNLPVLEAMATGCIVFATKDGAVADFINDGQDGFLFDSRDEKENSKKLIQQLLNMDRLQFIKENSLQKAKQYTRTKFDESYLQYFLQKEYESFSTK